MIDQRFTLDELGDAFGSELTEALEMGRQLEASIERIGLSLPARDTGFDVATAASGELGDRVMAALANEPAPATTGFLQPLRRLGVVRGLGASVRQAWVGLGGAGRPLLARGAALAYVLAITLAGVSLTGAATAGAIRLLGPDPTTSPQPTLPAPTLPAPTLAPPPPSQAPSILVPPFVAPTPSPSPSPSETPEESDDNGGNSGPGGGGDDSSGPGGGHDDSGPGSSDDDSSGPGSGDDRETPEPDNDSSGHGSGDD